MFLKYRNYAETTLDGAIDATQTTLRVFNVEAMPDVPFLIYLTEDTTLASLQTAERILCYAVDGDEYTVARDWDNLVPVESGAEVPITGSEGDTAFPDLFVEDDIYFRINDDPYLYRYASGVIEPPLCRDVTSETAYQVGTRAEWSRAAEWPNDTIILMLLGDVNIEELQYANRPYELPTDLVADTLTLTSHIQIGDTDVEAEGIIKYVDNDFWGYTGTEWLSLTEQGEGGGGTWEPPVGVEGDILYYTDETTLDSTSRISIGEAISIDDIQIAGGNLLIGNTLISEGSLSDDDFTMSLDELQVYANIYIGLDAPIIDLGGIVLDESGITLHDSVSIEQYVTWDAISEPIATDGSIYYDESLGFMAHQAGEWKPMLLTEIENPFPIPANEYETISYTNEDGWQPTGELLLDPEGAKFAHAIIVGERLESAPLVAGMIEYVNNDIQGILRHGESYIRVSLTNLIASQRLPEPLDGVIPFGSNDLWEYDENFVYSNSLLSTPMIKLGTETNEGMIRYYAHTMQWFNGTAWVDFAGGGASVDLPTELGTLLISDGMGWIEGSGITYNEGVLDTDKYTTRNLEIGPLGGESTAEITVEGEIYGTKLVIGDLQLSELGISGVEDMTVADLIVTGTLRAAELDIDNLPETWTTTTLNLGDYSLTNEEEDLWLRYQTTDIAKFTDDGVIFYDDVTVPTLTVDGEVTFNYAIVVGDEENPGLQDTPGMIRYNGDFQGNLGNGHWASFTLSLADGDTGLPGNPEAPFGTGLYWNGAQWYKNTGFHIGTDGAVRIGDTDTAEPGIIRYNPDTLAFEGCVDYGSWVAFTGSGGGAPTLPTGLVEDSTLRWTGYDWLENTELRSDGIMTWVNLLEIEPYENFYDTGAVLVLADAGVTTVQIKDFSIIPYGTIRFANHLDLYTVLEATSEVMLIGRVGNPELGLTTPVPAGTEIYIQGILPRPEAAGGQIRYNQNDFEGYVENIGWVSFTGHLSVLPTRMGDPLLGSGHGLYFDGYMWRAYHNIRMRTNVVEVDNNLVVTGNLEVYGIGDFDGVRVSDQAPEVLGMLRYAENRYQGYAVIEGGESDWVDLSSPILDAGAVNGDALIYTDGWWTSSNLINVKEAGVTMLPEVLVLDRWTFQSHSKITELQGGQDVQNVLSIYDEVTEEGDPIYYFSILGDSSQEHGTPFGIARIPMVGESWTLGYDDENFVSSTYLLDVNGSINVVNTINGATLDISGNADIDGRMRIGGDLYIDEGDLALLNGMVEAQSLYIYDEGYFGTTVRVGYKAGPSEVGAIRYSTPENAARGDWEGWDGEQWVSFTAGFHGQAIWGDPIEGNIVAFDGERWRPSSGMSVIDDAIYLGTTFLPGAIGADGEIRFTGTQVQVKIAGDWVVLNGGLPDMPEGSLDGQVLYWLTDTWLPTDVIQLSTDKLLVNGVLELAEYDGLIAADGGQIRYNSNDYEAYIEDIGWVSLTGHVPFQKPWEHDYRLLWSDGSNWVAYEGIEIDPLNSELTISGSLEIDGDFTVANAIIAGSRITSGAGVVLGIDNDPTDHTLYADEQNRLRYDGKTIGYGENNCDGSIPRGAVYWENSQFRNSSAVRMMTRSA